MKHPYRLLGYFFLLLGLLVQGCSLTKKEQVIFKKTTYSHLAGWRQDSVITVLAVLKGSCLKLLKKPPTREFINGLYVHDMHIMCRQLLSFRNDLREDDFRKYLEENFVPYKVFSNNKSSGLFTGYYIPILKGSCHRTKYYNIPIYSRPKDLVVVEDLGIFRSDQSFKNRRIAGKVQHGKLVPYYTRQEIESGVFNHKGYELFWVHDRVTLYLMQVQGSGILVTPDGKKTVLGYDGTNGHEYVSIGKILTEEDTSIKKMIDEGKLKRSDISLPIIKKWLQDNPKEAKEFMQRNKSYVFFKQMANSQILGSQQTRLYPMRSLAVDTADIPLGLPIWLDIHTKPALRKLVVSQDTGGAIKGAVRGDLYCGVGREAEKLAGIMKDQGEYYVLLPKNTTNVEK